MNQNRYIKLTKYQAELNTAYKSNSPQYTTLLSKVKADLFKVYRNSNGDHKLVDNLGNDAMDFSEIFGGLF